MHDPTFAYTRRLRTPSAPVAPAAPRHWRDGLPVLRGERLTLRELAADDGPALVPLITAPEVVRFMSPTPETPDWFGAFIQTTRRAREAGRYAGFAIVPAGERHPVGLTQIRQVAPGFATAEWGIAIGSAWWGKGLFEDAGRLVLGFVFDTLGAHRLEARVVTENARGNAAVRKLGATSEAVLSRALRTADGAERDQVLWAWLADDWRRERSKAQARQAEVLSWVH